MASSDNTKTTSLDNIVKNIAKKKGYITYNIIKRETSNKGYMGNILALDINGHTATSEEEINLFIKQILHPQIKMIYDVPSIYKREKIVYTNIFKEMLNLQKEAHVPVADRFRTASVFDESDDENIILENLAAIGYKTYDRLEILNLEYAELCIKALARIHGLSLALQIKRPDYFEENIKKLDCVYVFDEYFHGFQHNVRKTAIQFLPEDLREKLTAKIVDAVDRYKTYMNDESCLVRTVCHGDFRASNIMVKEIDGKPTEVIPVDYQITYFGNPVLDLIYLIFWGSDQQFRRLHLENLKQLYYHHLKTYLLYFSIDVEDIFPRKEFERQFQEKLDFGLMISVFYLPCIFPKEEDVPNFEESTKSLNEMQLKIDEKFGERFRGIVDDFIEWGYL